MSEEPILALPSVRVPSLGGLSVTIQSPAPPTPDELIESLYERLRETAPRRQRSSVEAAQMGDDVVCDLVVLVGGHLIPGGVRSRVTLELRDYPMLPGLVPGLVGLKLESEKTVGIELPQDYPVKKFAGTQGEVLVYVHEIHEVHQPDMEDGEALMKAGLGDSIEEAMRIVAQKIDGEQGEELLVTATQAVLAEFGNRVKIDLLEELIDSELLRVWEQNYEETLLQSGFDDDQIDGAWFDYAEDSALREEVRLKLKTDAGLRAVVEEQQFTPDPADLERLVKNSADALGIEEAVFRSVAKKQGELRDKLVRSSIHLQAVEYVMARAHIEVLD